MLIDLDYFAAMVKGYDAQHPLEDAVARHTYETIKNVVTAVRHEIEVMTRENDSANKSEEEMMASMGAAIFATMLDKRLSDVLGSDGLEVGDG